MTAMPQRCTRKRLLAILPIGLWVGGHLGAPTAWGESQEEQSVQASIAVLNEIMVVPARAIPERMLAGAQGVAIIPRVIKGGFVIGARRGHGTLLVREEGGGWHAPVFITLTGGSIGWQAGVQATDVVLVFKTKRSLQGIFASKFTLGVDVAAAAGPVGRQASAATDAQLKAEIYSYARSRGLFLGASLDGSVLQVDGIANAAYYQSQGPTQTATIPAAALQLVQLLATYSSATVSPPQTTTETAPPLANNQTRLSTPQTPTLAEQYATHESDVIREQLSRTSPELFERLDPTWRSYLALPAELFSQQRHPTVESIEASLLRYEQVRQDPQYQSLTSMPSFQSTYGLLRHYLSTLSQTETPLLLPPPPGVR